MSKHGELVKNTLAIFIGKFFTQFLSFLLIPIYTRFISTSDYGTVDLFITYINLIAPVITIQQEMASFRFLVEARGDKETTQKIIRSSIESATIRTGIFSILYLIICAFIDSRYEYLALLAGVSIIYSNLLLQIARGLGKNIKYSIGIIISGAVTLIANLVLICGFGLGGESLLISMALANLACLFYLLVALSIPSHIKSSARDKSLKKTMLKYSWPLVPNGISWWLINASDRTIVSLILGVSANGIYAVANKFPSIISGALGVFALSWSESASLHINDKDRDEFFSSVFRNTLKIFSSLCILTIAILPLVFDIIVGHEYIEAYQYIPIFLVGSIFNCLVAAYSAIYIAKKLTKQVAATSIISAAINIVIDLILINFIGLYAAAISTAIAFFAMTIYRHYDSKKYVKITYGWSNIAISTIGFLVVIGAYYLNNNFINYLSALFAVIFACICLAPSGKKMLLLLTKKRK